MPSAKLRVLVVDRDKSVTDSLVMALQHGGFDAVAAFSNDDAIARATQDAFDVLLTDVMMEPVNGIEIALAILRLRPEIRVVLFSGNPDASRILNQAAAAGQAFEILAKPLHPVELFRCLRGEAAPETAQETAHADRPRTGLLEFAGLGPLLETNDGSDLDD